MNSVRLESLGDNEFLAQYYVDDIEYVVSFFLENNEINYIHIENIDQLSYDEIEKAYMYFETIKEAILC